MVASPCQNTIISFNHDSEVMLVQTTDYDMMRFLDDCVIKSERWKLIEVGRVKGEIVSKTYEAPKKYLSLKAVGFCKSEDKIQNVDSPAETEDTHLSELDRFQQAIFYHF